MATIAGIKILLDRMRPPAGRDGYAVCCDCINLQIWQMMREPSITVISITMSDSCMSSHSECII